jgi:hypothetical protein
MAFSMPITRSTASAAIRLIIKNFPDTKNCRHYTESLIFRRLAAG